MGGRCDTALRGILVTPYDGLLVSVAYIVLCRIGVSGMGKYASKLMGQSHVCRITNYGDAGSHKTLSFVHL